MRILTALPILAAALLVCSGCDTNGTTSPASPAVSSPSVTPEWVTDHTAIVHGAYTAFCAPAIEYSPDTPTDPGALREISITEHQYRWLHRGDACPGR